MRLALSKFAGEQVAAEADQPAVSPLRYKVRRMKKVFVIGIGAGNPDYVTIQAINALNEVHVFFIIDKGQEKEELVRVREEICERHIKDKSYRLVETADPPRDRKASAYEPAVRAWHEQRAGLYERLICEELGENECGAFLVWGDPSLYDSTLCFIDLIVARGNHHIRIRGHSGHQRHSGISRKAQDRPQSNWPIGSHNDGPQDCRGSPE